MLLNFQKEPIEQLRELADSDRHSILIDGGLGCGKSYVAKQFAAMKDIKDCYFVTPTVSAIRDAIDHTYNISDNIVLCIENLDLGVAGASYTLLKFLEEPKSNVYIIVTCRNRYRIPDTIISRSTTVNISHPTDNDIKDYAQITNEATYNRLSGLPVWKAVKSLRDVDNVYKMDDSQLSYYQELTKIFSFSDSVSNIVWKLQHYSDNTETDLVFVMNFLMSSTKNKDIKRKVMECTKDLATSRVAAHAVLTKFVFDCKYGA